MLHYRHGRHTHDAEADLTLTVSPSVELAASPARLPLARGGTNVARVRVTNYLPHPVDVTVAPAALAGVAAEPAAQALTVPALGSSEAAFALRARGRRAAPPRWPSPPRPPPASPRPRRSSSTLGVPTLVGSVTMVPRVNYGPRAYTVEVSDDGAAWQTVASVASARGRARLRAMAQQWRRTAAVVAALALGAALAYLPALEGDWVWDDANLVRPSPALRDLRGLGEAVSTDLYRQAAPRLEASAYWRPLALASYWLDTRLGYAPRALHLGNVLLHAAAAALLALVLLRRYRDAAGWAGVVAAGLATAWWALHPQNVEAVAWISCRYDLLTGVALLGLLALPWRPGWGRAALHGLVFLAGLLSKDGFGAMAAAVVAMDWADRRAPRAAAPRWVTIGAALAGWSGARAALAIPSFDLPGWSLVPGLVGRYLDAIVIYLVRAVAPLPLTVGHPYGPSVLRIAIGAAVFLALVAAAARWRRLAVPIAVFLAGLVPVALAMARYGEVPERYFYVPAIGLAALLGDLVAASLAARRRGVRIAVPALVGVAALVGLVRVELRLPDWRSDDTLFAASLAVNPDDPQANLHVGTEASRRREWGKARAAFERARRSDPSSGRIASALAWALLQTGDVGAAAREAQAAADLEPYQPDTWWTLTLARHEAGDHAGELTAVEKVLELSPDYPNGRAARALAACEVSGRTDCIEAVKAGTLR